MFNSHILWYYFCLFSTNDGLDSTGLIRDGTITVILLVAIVVKLVVRGHGDETAPGTTEGKKNL